MIDQNKKLSDRLDKFDQKNTLEERTAAILAKAKEYSIPEELAKDFNIKDDADLDEYFKDKKQVFNNFGFKDAKAPESPEVEIKKRVNRLQPQSMPKPEKL